jgi:bifunctional ADP-heptose synthase (sugar kinase/adenylyltransferase)
MHNIMQCLDGFGSPRVALLGDFMLDRYVYGEVDRISP